MKYVRAGFLSLFFLVLMPGVSMPKNSEAGILEIGIVASVIKAVTEIKEVFDKVKEGKDAIEEVIGFFRESEPDIRELLAGFKKEIVDEIHGERDRRWAAAGYGLLQRYHQDIVLSPPPYDTDAWLVKLDHWLADVADVNAQLLDIASSNAADKSDTYKLAKAYNSLLVPYISVMAIRGYDYTLIVDYLKMTTIPTNNLFLGKMVAREKGNMAVYQRNKGQLWEEKLLDEPDVSLNLYLKNKNGSKGLEITSGVNDREFSEFDDAYQLAWRVNEVVLSLIENTPRRYAGWNRLILIENENAGTDPKCLFSPFTGKGYGEVFLKPCGHSEEYLWQVVPQRYDDSVVVHWSGNCLYSSHLIDVQTNNYSDVPRVINCDRDSSKKAREFQYRIHWDLRGANEGVFLRALWLGREEACCPSMTMGWPFQGGYLTPEGAVEEPQFSAIYNDNNTRFIDKCYVLEGRRASCPRWKVELSNLSDLKYYDIEPALLFVN